MRDAHTQIDIYKYEIIIEFFLTSSSSIRSHSKRSACIRIHKSDEDEGEEEKNSREKKKKKKKTGENKCRITAHY